MKTLVSLIHALRTSYVPILVVAVALEIALCSINAPAQSGAGSIQGTVQDATHAVIPGASIRVVNIATGVVFTTKSNSVGFYQAPELFTGTYSVTVTAPGMKAYTTSIDLLVAQSAVVNPVLTAGAVTQQVTVNGNAVQLTTTDNGAITSTLEDARIDQLPMNGRSLVQLTGETTPGLEGQKVNGLVPEALAYVLDGVPTMEPLTGGTLASMIDPDSVQEVRVQMNASGAQFATPATGIVTTKSGTNSLHGSFFETARNNAIGIAKSRDVPSNFSAPRYVRNEFGGSAGGPIILPHIYHGKNKSFWFFAYERYSLANSTAIEAGVPTTAMRQGNFSGLTNKKGISQTIYDPATTANSSKCDATGGKANPYCRTPFPNNQIPIAKISPMAKIYYQLVPQPTSSDNPLVANNFNITAPEFEEWPHVTFRLDHVFNENNRAYLRYTQNTRPINTSITGVENLALPGIPVGAAMGYKNSTATSFLPSVSYTHVFSPTFFMETIFSQEWDGGTTLKGVAPNADYEAMLGLPNNFGEAGFPQIKSLITPVSGSQAGDNNHYIFMNLDVNLTKTLGRHQMTFGARYRHERVADRSSGLKDAITSSALPTGIYDTKSGANYKNLTNAGYADASFFLGSANSYQITMKQPTIHYHLMELDGYFQDNYHVSRNLTVNLGLRYEAHPALWEKYGIFNSFDLKNDAMVLAAPPATLIAEGYTTQALIADDENIGIKFETPAQAGMPSALLRNYNLNVLPRAGFAYQPFGGRFGTVIRGAYGRYDYPLPFAYWVNQTGKNNPLTAAYSQDYTNASQAIDGLPNELIRYNAPAVFGVMGANTTNVVNSNATNGILPGVTVSNSGLNLAPSFVTETNFTIEQPLKGNSALRLSWVWTHATNLDIVDSYNNQPSNFQWEMATGTVPPTGGASVIGTPLQNTYAATAMGPYDQTTWGANDMREATGWSNDNALEVNYHRLFHNGSAYQVMYVYSKALAVGGNASSTVYPDANYPGVLGTAGTMSSPYGTIGFAGAPPPARPANLPVWADWHAMDRYQGYQLDSGTPKMHIRFNGIIDLPFGHGKRFLGNANRFVNELIGGFQLAGAGEVVSQVFQPGTNWGPVHPLKVYKHHAPIIDCRSGSCYKAYMWYNGYIAPTASTGVTGSVCTSNCVSGLPTDYEPVQTPIDNDPTSAYYGTNDVEVSSPTLNASNGGQPVTIGYDGGPQAASYLGKSWFNGPVNWNADLSLFKVFPIREKVRLRLNMDAFNAFNIQGYNNPGADGVEQVQPGVGQASSYWAPRQIQLTARLTF